MKRRKRPYASLRDDNSPLTADLFPGGERAKLRLIAMLVTCSVVTLVAMKLTRFGVVGLWPWWRVLAPLWGAVLAPAVALATIFCLALLHELGERVLGSSK